MKPVRLPQGKRIGFIFLSNAVGRRISSLMNHSLHSEPHPDLTSINTIY